MALGRLCVIPAQMRAGAFNAVFSNQIYRARRDAGPAYFGDLA
jgi:hypothetical protein